MAIHAHRPAVWCLRIASIVALVALFLPSTAHADSECKKGYRDFTAAERATMTSTLQRAVKTFPEPPAGWMRTLTHEDVSTPASLCRDVEQRPWEFNYTRHYNRIPDQDSDNKAIAKIAASGQELQKKKQARLDALRAKLNKVSQQRVALITKGDMAGAEKFDPEVERLTAEHR